METEERQRAAVSPRQKPCHSSPGLSFYSVLSPKSMSLDTAACLQVPVIDLWRPGLWDRIPGNLPHTLFWLPQAEGVEEHLSSCSGLSLLGPMISQGPATLESLLTRGRWTGLYRPSGMPHGCQGTFQEFRGQKGHRFSHGLYTLFEAWLITVLMILPVSSSRFSIHFS